MLRVELWGTVALSWRKKLFGIMIRDGMKKLRKRRLIITRSTKCVFEVLSRYIGVIKKKPE